MIENELYSAFTSIDWKSELYLLIDILRLEIPHHQRREEADERSVPGVLFKTAFKGEMNDNSLSTK